MNCWRLSWRCCSGRLGIFPCVSSASSYRVWTECANVRVTSVAAAVLEKHVPPFPVGESALLPRFELVILNSYCTHTAHTEYFTLSVLTAYCTLTVILIWSNNCWKHYDVTIVLFIFLYHDLGVSCNCKSHWYLSFLFVLCWLLLSTLYLCLFSVRCSIIHDIYVCSQLDALEYIHKQDYVHADIKASNLLTGYIDEHNVSIQQFNNCFTCNLSWCNNILWSFKTEGPMTGVIGLPVNLLVGDFLTGA